MKLPQLSLRDLFWLVLVVAMGLGWWLYAKHQTRTMREAERRHVEEIELLAEDRDKWKWRWETVGRRSTVDDFKSALEGP